MLKTRFDESENVKFNNPYKRNKWYDTIIDPTLPEDHPDHIIEKGSTHTARKYNHFEDGIYHAFERIVSAEHDHRRLQSKVELKDRTDSDHTFLDVMDGSDPQNATLDVRMTEVAEEAKAGAQTIKVDKTVADLFRVGEELTVCNGAEAEHVIVEKIDNGVLTINELENNYAKGSLIGRSVAERDTVHGHLRPAKPGTYTLSVG